MISYSMSEPICTEQPFSCAAMRNGVIFRLITTSPRTITVVLPLMTSALLASSSRRARARRQATTHGFDHRDRLACTARDSRTGTRFASAPAARTASMVAHNDQVKGGRVPGFPHPVEPAGGTRRHGWGYRERTSVLSGYTATVPTPVRKWRGRPCFRSQPVGHESFGHEQSFCPAASSMPPLDGESVARRPRTPLLRGEPRIRCIPVSVQLTES